MCSRHAGLGSVASARIPVRPVNDRYAAHGGAISRISTSTGNGCIYTTGRPWNLNLTAVVRGISSNTFFRDAFKRHGQRRASCSTALSRPTRRLRRQNLSNSPRVLSAFSGSIYFSPTTDDLLTPGSAARYDRQYVVHCCQEVPCASVGGVCY